MLLAVTSLISPKKKFACLSPGSHLSTSLLPAWPLMSRCGGVRPQDVRRRGKVKRLAARRDLCVHYPLNSTESPPPLDPAPAFPREQCLLLEKRWLAFAPGRRMLNEGRPWRQIEKRSHLNIATEEEEKKKKRMISHPESLLLPVWA